MPRKRFWKPERRGCVILEGKKGVKKVYDVLSRNYDSSEHLSATRKMEVGEEKIVKQFLRLLSHPVLDVGCGTGRYVVEVAGEGLEVIALDVSFGMLSQMRRKAQSLGVLGTIHPVVADGENIPVRERSVKGLVCTLTMDHFENREKAVEEFSRVLGGGGLCIITTMNERVLEGFRKLHMLPPGKMSFRAGILGCFLVYEDSIPLHVFKNIVEKYFQIVDVRGCFYCYLLPSGLTNLYYRTGIDSFLGSLKPLLKYAGLHVMVLRKPM